MNKCKYCNKILFVPAWKLCDDKECRKNRSAIDNLRYKKNKKTPSQQTR